jgi:hypothetical protein
MSWGRYEKRLYGKILSWCKEALGRGCQLIRVDLTSVEGVGDLKKDFQELRRRIEREFGYYVEYFKVETGEGFGVYHLIFAIKYEGAVWIPQSWLSTEWGKIHGAYIVYIKRMGKSKNDVKWVGKYFVSQYLAGQKLIVRISWSWWRARVAIVKAWKFMCREYRKRSEIYTWSGLNAGCVTLDFKQLLIAWDDLLRQGFCVMGDKFYIVNHRLVEEYGDVLSS